MERANKGKKQVTQLRNSDVQGFDTYTETIKGVPRTDFRGGQNEREKIRRAKSQFLAQIYQIFSKVDLFSKKFVH